jgi:hypothetical protein
VKVLPKEVYFFKRGFVVFRSMSSLSLSHTYTETTRYAMNKDMRD